jgi:hypothetical protein
MKISKDVIEFTLIFGVSGLLFALTRPSNNRKPTTTQEPDLSTQTKNANTVKDAYLLALKSGESAARLEELNRLTETKYGMRVFKKSDGKYYVMDTKGNIVKLK